MEPAPQQQFNWGEWHQQVNALQQAHTDTIAQHCRPMLQYLSSSSTLRMRSSLALLLSVPLWFSSRVRTT